MRLLKQPARLVHCTSLAHSAVVFHARQWSPNLLCVHSLPLGLVEVVFTPLLIVAGSQSPRRVLAYSFYGNSPRYNDGAIANAELLPLVYPGWEMWLYHDNSVSAPLLARLGGYPHVKLLDMTGSKLRNQMTWRFLVASREGVSRYIIRDIDDRLTLRQSTAVAEWIESGKKFHVMRDHPEHSRFPVSGGMWGGTADAVPEMEQLLMQKNPNGDYVADMNFLTNHVWSLMQARGVLQHDSFTPSPGKYGVLETFPLSRSVAVPATPPLISAMSWPHPYTAPHTHPSAP